MCILSSLDLYLHILIIGSLWVVAKAQQTPQESQALKAIIFMKVRDA